MHEEGLMVAASRYQVLKVVSTRVISPENGKKKKETLEGFTRGFTQVLHAGFDIKL